jgi:asparagine synthase (glutamine-hydrolysing)
MHSGVVDENKCAQQSSLTFRALGADAEFLNWSGETTQLNLDGLIQLGAGKLINVNGPGRQDLIDALLKRYRTKGEDFLKELAGSFRLALWDSERRKLLVAVDPFGTKPLYFSSANGVLHFAPRISLFSGLAGLSKDIDPNALYFYLNHSFIPAPFTVYREIRRLEPGQYLCWQNGQLTIRHYWDLHYDEDFTLTEDSAAELIRATVERSVRSYLDARVCEVPEIGAFLSGGTDSSTVVGLMTKLSGSRIKTFSVGFTEELYNEIEYAHMAAERYNALAHDHFVSADQALSTLPVLAAQFDEPFGNSSAIPTYFCLQTAKTAGVKVMFAGDGGDELFGGNERYLTEKYFLPFDFLPQPLQAVSGRMAAFLPHVYPLGKVRRYLEQAREPNPKRYFRHQLFFSERADEFLTDDFRANIERDFDLRMPRQHYQKIGAVASLNRLLYMDLKMCIADNDLFKVNQMAAASGVNVCYPYLDRELAELTGRIPAALKLKGLRKRYIFKKAFEKLLPEEILRKKKHGFGMPTGEWLRHHCGFRDLARSLLLEPRAVHRGYFKRSALERLLKLHDEEKSSYYGTYIWYFMMLELWHRQHADGVPVRQV